MPKRNSLGRNSLEATVFTAVLYLVASPPAYAYLDPGSGSMIIQILVVAVAGAMWTLRSYWIKIKSFFGFSPKEKAPDPARNSERSD